MGKNCKTDTIAEGLRGQLTAPHQNPNSCLTVARAESGDMLTYHRTSLFTSTAQTIVNTVNTVGVMGKGIAAAFKTRYPEMFHAYQKLCREKKFEVGMLWLWKAPDQWVLNFPTKQHWRNPSKLEYIEAGLKKFVAEYERRGIREISFPRLGCGNGGLEWSQVRREIEAALSELDAEPCLVLSRDALDAAHVGPGNEAGVFARTKHDQTWRVRFQPLTTSKPWPSLSRNRGISAGSSWRSPSSVKTTSPRAT